MLFDHTAEGLAQQWCFILTRKRGRGPADNPFDMADAFRELLRQGADPKVLLAEVLRESRNRNEHFWQFEKRVSEGAGAKGGEGAASARSGGGHGSGVRPSSRVVASEDKLAAYRAKTIRISDAPTGDQPGTPDMPAVDRQGTG